MAHYSAPRGTQDILPEDQPYWRYIQERIHGVAQLYGYRQLDIPIFEDTALFEQGVGEATDIVEKEMYSFLDKGGNPITLRPEFTAGVVRAYLEHGMHVRPQPVKVYSIGPCFRYERPQAGRYRQHTQFNVEAIGVQDPAMDLEVMSVAWHLYEDLGFKGLSFQLNSIGCLRCRPDFLRVLVEYYQGHRDHICDDCRRRLERNPLRLLDCKTESCQPIIEAAPQMGEYLCDECAEHFQTLLGYLDSLGRPYTLSHRLVRGFDYYTKTVFEVWAEGIGAQNAVCGGGRYDGLAEVLGGPPTPGVGFASGLERIVLTMKHQGVQVPTLPSPQALIAHLGQQAKLIGVKLASDLRAAGIGALISFGERSLKAQLRQANRQGVAFALIIGEREAEAGQVTVRDMVKGEQHPVALEEVTSWLSQRLGRD
ncbi:MAG: histidine--tRNA ligase [Anaerolineae bacterium]|nr:histidine--tRNA ligase [Anaerolineae bacterium]